MQTSLCLSWRRVGFPALVLSLVLVALGRAPVFAGTLTVTAVDNIKIDTEYCDSEADGSHTMSLVSKDSEFGLRNGIDKVVYEYSLKAQASADWYYWCNVPFPLGDADALVQGNLKFSFQLPDVVTLWDIYVGYDYHGVVAIDSNIVSNEDVTAYGISPQGTGVVSSLGATSLPGAKRTSEGASHFDGLAGENISGIFGINEPGEVSFFVHLHAISGDGEAYASLGQRAGFDGFGLDNTYYDPTDGLQIRLVFTPHLNLSGQLLTSDLSLAAGETLSGFGTFYGDISGVVGSAIAVSSGDLKIGNPSSASGFNMAGDIEVAGGTLVVNDADNAVLTGYAHVSGSGKVKVPGELQNDGVIALDGGVLDVGSLTGVGSLKWTQGTLKSNEAVVVGPEFVLGESLTMSLGKALVTDDVLVETGGSLTISGGTVFGNIDAWNGSEVNISGGSIAGYGPSGRPNRLYAHRDSTINVFGTKFILDGTDITATLIANVPFIIGDRDVGFSGLLADGSPFSFDLEYFSPSATFRVTLVPEPASVLMVLGLATAGLLSRLRTEMKSADRN